jgi:hypothetical protein
MLILLHVTYSVFHKVTLPIVLNMIAPPEMWSWWIHLLYRMSAYYFDLLLMLKN